MLLCCAGALRLHDAQVNITNSFLGWNLAHRNGGAIFVGTHETDKSLNSTLRLVNTTFDTNLAEATGGEDMVARPLTCDISAAGSYGRLPHVVHILCSRAGEARLCRQPPPRLCIWLVSNCTDNDAT
jgi:hypothetical protein